LFAIDPDCSPVGFDLELAEQVACNSRYTGLSTLDLMTGPSAPSCQQRRRSDGRSAGGSTLTSADFVCLNRLTTGGSCRLQSREFSPVLSRQVV